MGLWKSFKCLVLVDPDSKKCGQARVSIYRIVMFGRYQCIDPLAKIIELLLFLSWTDSDIRDNVAVSSYLMLAYFISHFPQVAQHFYLGMENTVGAL